MRITKYWKNKAKCLSAYVRDDYNEGRALIATIGSAGIFTFEDDLEMLVLALRDCGDKALAEVIEKKEWMILCGQNLFRDATEKKGGRINDQIPGQPEPRYKGQRR